MRKRKFPIRTSSTIVPSPRFEYAIKYVMMNTEPMARVTRYVVGEKKNLNQRPRCSGGMMVLGVTFSATVDAAVGWRGGSLNDTCCFGCCCGACISSFLSSVHPFCFFVV